jgi:MoaA/NifB/PqqE/SkfB family radical SAM enzyme
MAAEVPISASLELTHRCNLRCGFCCNRRSKDERPLTVDEWLLVIRELRELGTLYVTLTGGEPLTHPRFFEIASAVRERHMAVRLLTNGTLIDAESAERIAELRPLSVELSLHGAVAATHDAATGVAGSLDEMWRAIDLLDERGVPTALKTPVTRANARELTEIAAIAERRGLPIRIDPKITSRDDGNRSTERCSVATTQLDRVYRELHSLGNAPKIKRTENGANCGLGHLTVAVDPSGDVYPCVLWRSSSLGNIRERSLSEIWSGRERRRMADVSRRANDAMIGIGGAMTDFPFCPALAARDGGDPTAATPTMKRHAEASHTAKEAR